MTAIDFQILHSIQSLFGSDFLNIVMPVLTRIGDGGFVWIMIALGLMLHKDSRHIGYLMIIALIVGAVFGNLILKYLIARPRPCVQEPQFAVLAKCVSGYSFPSGHSLSSFAAASVLYFTRTKFSWAALIVAVLIAFSRTYLYFHFMSDVVAGAVIGCFVGWAVVQISRSLGQEKSRS